MAQGGGMKRAAIFLDRDGTLIHDRHYLKDPNHIRYYKGSREALKALQDEGYVLVIITNQSGIGRGLFRVSDMRRVHRRLQSDLKRAGVRLGGIYVCPHEPDHHCLCRKPGTLLYHRAARDLKINLARSFLVGDRLSDVEAAPRLRAQGIMVQTGHYHSQPLNTRSARRYAVEKSLAAAARKILKGDHHAVPRHPG